MARLSKEEKEALAEAKALVSIKQLQKRMVIGGILILFILFAANAIANTIFRTSLLLGDWNNPLIYILGASALATAFITPVSGYFFSKEGNSAARDSVRTTNILIGIFVGSISIMLIANLLGDFYALKVSAVCIVAFAVLTLAIMMLLHYGPKAHEQGVKHDLAVSTAQSGTTATTKKGKATKIGAKKEERPLLHKIAALVLFLFLIGILARIFAPSGTTTVQRSSTTTTSTTAATTPTTTTTTTIPTGVPIFKDNTLPAAFLQAQQPQQANQPVVTVDSNARLGSNIKKYMKPQ